VTLAAGGTSQATSATGCRQCGQAGAALRPLAGVCGGLATGVVGAGGRASSRAGPVRLRGLRFGVMPAVFAPGAAEPLAGGGGGPGELAAAGGARPLLGGHGRACVLAVVALRRTSARCWWARIR